MWRLAGVGRIGQDVGKENKKIKQTTSRGRFQRLAGIAFALTLGFP